jgi:hypothetical protein
MAACGLCDTTNELLNGFGAINAWPQFSTLLAMVNWLDRRGAYRGSRDEPELGGRHFCERFDADIKAWLLRSMVGTRTLIWDQRAVARNFKSVSNIVHPDKHLVPPSPCGAGGGGRDTACFVCFRLRRTAPDAAPGPCVFQDPWMRSFGGECYKRLANINSEIKENHGTDACPRLAPEKIADLTRQLGTVRETVTEEHKATVEELELAKKEAARLQAAYDDVSLEKKRLAVDNKELDEENDVLKGKLDRARAKIRKERADRAREDDERDARREAEEAERDRVGWEREQRRRREVIVVSSDEEGSRSAEEEEDTTSGEETSDGEDDRSPSRSPKTCSRHRLSNCNCHPRHRSRPASRNAPARMSVRS